MRKFLVLLTLLGLATTQSANAHKEWVHQYMVQQAYLFLQNQLGSIPELQRAAGSNYHGQGWNTITTSSYLNPSALDNQTTVGAWQEDVEDWVYGYNADNAFTPSITHFWKADNGDNTRDVYLYDFSGNGTYYPNAWEKARAYLFCQDTYGNPRSITVPYIANGVARRYIITYSSLGELYKGHYFLEGTSNVGGGNYVAANHVAANDPTFGQPVALNILGRVAHLLGDMSVPAHAHAHLHPCPAYLPDYYENNMGGVWSTHNGRNECESDPGGTYPAQSWNANTAAQRGGLMTDTYCEAGPLSQMRYLFYTLNQLTDYFPSGVTNAQANDPNGPSHNQNYFVGGNSDLPNGSNAYLQARYQALQAQLGGPPSNIVQQTIADETFNCAIRATATLFQWFAFDAGIIQDLKNSHLSTSNALVCPGGNPVTVYAPAPVGFSSSISWSVSPSYAATGAAHPFISNAYVITPTSNQQSIMITVSATYNTLKGDCGTYYTPTLTKNIWKGTPSAILRAETTEDPYELQLGTVLDVVAEQADFADKANATYSWAVTNGGSVLQQLDANGNSRVRIQAPTTYRTFFYAVATITNNCGSQDLYYSLRTRYDTPPCPSCEQDYRTAPVAASPTVSSGEDETKGLTIYPNPSSTEFEIRYSSTLGSQAKMLPNFRIVDVLGRSLMEGQLSTATTHIDTSQLMSGIYLVTVFDNGVEQHQRVQVLH